MRASFQLGYRFALTVTTIIMKRIVLTFGLILGTLLCINGVIAVNMVCNNPDFEGNTVIGYAILVVVFSLIFFGIRNYRNKQLGGFISFGKAFKTGLLIALVASTLYVGAWLFYYYLFVPEFLDKYIAIVLRDTPTADLAAKTAEMQSFKEMYKNPLFIILITYFEILPIGIVVALISALALKKKRKAEA